MRLFSEVPWIGPQLVAAVRDYARDITIDTDRIESALQSVDPTDAEALQAALQDQLFRPDQSPAQRAALGRLETYLALVEGWVDVVTDRATRDHLPQAAALGEAVRRRRATGGPAEKAFAGLVGLELRPRRLRDAANLWSALESAHGSTGRDAAWGHPDVAPTAADLDDPLGYVERVGSSASTALDAALDEILRGGEDTTGPRARAEVGGSAEATAAADVVPAAYLRLRDDARRTLEQWHAPDAQQEQLRTELLEHCERAPRRAVEAGAARPPDGEHAGAQPLARQGAADPARQGPAVAAVRGPLRACRRKRPRRRDS